MKLPLTLYSLLFLALLALYAFTQMKKQPRGTAGQPAPRKSPQALAVAEMVQDALRIYVLFAGASVLSIALGKPDLTGQYAAWGILIAQVLKCGTIAREMAPATLALRLISLAALAYLWVLNLPFFDILPS